MAYTIQKSGSIVYHLLGQRGFFCFLHTVLLDKMLRLSYNKFMTRKNAAKLPYNDERKINYVRLFQTAARISFA